jgi:hypothetical protein
MHYTKDYGRVVIDCEASRIIGEVLGSILKAPRREIMRIA